ncbi:50S ribosomal protein L25 [Candidatus Curculioniphilus buchneri]|uniref:50S ribosomal protein L25 n=1 Tax=Candidatus Curculioniphilus buchneri TaxID=690594 RepID=UPI00376ED1D1
MLTINADIRKKKGTRASRRLRFTNRVPAIVYGGIEGSIAIELDQNAILNNQTKENFYSQILALIIDGIMTTVKVQSIQRHPFKPKLIHIDFIRLV